MGGIATEPRSIDRLVREMESDELIGLAQQLESLRLDPRFEKLMELMDIEISKLRRSMETGQLRSLEKYAHAGGCIRGAGLSLAIIDDISKKARAVLAQLEREG